MSLEFDFLRSLLLTYSNKNIQIYKIMFRVSWDLRLFGATCSKLKIECVGNIY